MNKSCMRRMVAIYLTLMLSALPALACAHSGRTDASGGHKDNKNKSGLGSYHYHCGGHPAHLHSGGVCPYSKGSSSKPSSSQSSGKTSGTAASSASSSARTDSDRNTESVISDAVRQGIVTPAVSADTGSQSVSILLGYANKTVNIRQEPSADSKKIGHIIKGEKIMVIQKDYAPRWHQILFGDQIGYVSAKYCDLTDIVTKIVQVSEY